MSRYWKKIKKKVRVFLRRPWAKWVLLGALAIVLVLIVAAVLLLRGGSEPPITEGNTTTVTLVAGGDLNVTDQTVASGDDDYTSAFLDVAQIFAQADASWLNFEGNVCGAPYGSDTCSAPQSMLDTLGLIGVDFLQTANSCCVKNGMNGLAQTLTAIRAAGITPLGTYATNAEFSASQGYVLRSINGVKVAFVAFTKGMDGMGLPTGSEKCVNLLYTDYTSTYKTVNTAGITAVLQAAQAASPDIVIALVHWGSENNSTISSTQTRIVKLMKQNGVDAVIGTHSHQVQSVDYDEENHTLVAYSLGDFYGDARESGNQYSVLLQLQITKNWDTGAAAITGWDYIPIYTLTPERDGETMRVVQIRTALEQYENDHISKVGQTAYENMKSALTQIEKKIQPTQS